MVQSNGDTDRRIVVAGVDFSPVGELALEHVLELAAEDPSVEPHLVHVAQPYGPLLRLEIGDASRAVTMDQASAYLRAHVEQHVKILRSKRAVRFARAIAHVRVGAPAEQIGQLAVDLDADLVVVGTHGRRGIRRMLLGSVAEAVIRLAPCPVYVVRPKHGGRVHPAESAPLRAACERCLEVRRATLGEIFWCDEHRGNRPSSEVRAHQPHASS